MSGVYPDVQESHPWPVQRQARLVLAVLALAVVVGGCRSASSIDEGRPYPEPFRIELITRYEDGRRTAYRLEPDGSLHFAGGRNVDSRSWSESGKPTLEQRLRLYQIIDEHDLLEAGGALFASAEQVRYNVTLRAGPRRAASYRTVDDRVEGLAELKEALASLHRELVDREIYRAIEGTIRREGGNVPRR